ncbi:L-cysteine desulfhydrase [Anopheles sinensis]|uniref:L-cysteine desulfhydrase n=1 Tax=Anopheles sinensis TaxID=74873 RepID=A0A084VKY9_ANOSI|nr:L-cysteine desulfhydrase [Anopheles sinensis]
MPWIRHLVPSGRKLTRWNETRGRKQKKPESPAIFGGLPASGMSYGLRLIVISATSARNSFKVRSREWEKANASVGRISVIVFSRPPWGMPEVLLTLGALFLPLWAQYYDR